ncbi:MAG: enoyl-CoA hydratase/isomerase family protein [Candidatus Acidiferrales bacterium]
MDIGERGRLIGRARALEIFSTGRTISAAEAHEWGLVRRIVAAENLLAQSYSEISCPKQSR